MQFLLVAISLGFLGSFHCIGMCGPIALALPLGNSSPIKKTFLIISYNLGRILTYSVFGIFAGIVGKTFALAGYQQALSVSIGVVLLLIVFVPAKYTHGNSFVPKIFSFFNAVKTEFGKLFLKKGHGTLFTIGLLNGLLPCGLVYLGIAGSIATGDILNGALFMAAFGLGTLPVMLALPYAGSFIGLATRNTMRKTIPVVVTLTALLLILRGLNLGIPYVSPNVDKAQMTAACHTTESTDHPKTIVKCIGPNSPHKK
ncbi:MAG: sulfite exporter TauE/SafE family protein [bacterium]|nr:sulfite exporter TauE/SafE family protein [bacterium]